MKKILALLLALAVLIGGWWYASPLMALDGLREAAEAGNEAELEERVDFPALRSSLKDQLRTALTEVMRNEGGDNPLGAAGAALGLGLVDGIVDGLVTPEWVARAVAEGQKRQGQVAAARETLPVREPAGPDTPGTPEPRAIEPKGEPDRMSQSEPRYEIEREGLSSFRVRIESPAGEAGTTLLFARDGLGWDLVGIEMPASALIPGR